MQFSRRIHIKSVIFQVPEGEGWRTVLYDARYRAVLREELRDLLKEAGFSDIGWKTPAESGYYQPIVIARV